MSGYEKQNWPSPYAAPQGQGEYQQQPPYEPQQAWNQQPYAQQQGGYQPPQAYPPQQGGYPAASSYIAPQGFGAPPPGPYGSSQPQQSYGSPPPPQGQYGPPQVPSYGAPPPSQNQYGLHQPPPPPQGQYGAPPPQGQYSSPPPHYGAPPQQQQQQQQWGGAPPQGPPGGPETRHSVSFKFTGTKKTILNSQVMDPYGKVPFNVVSDKKNTTVRASDGTTLAMVEWNHSVPIMHYGGKKLKCKEWIVWNNSKKVRVLTHAGKEYHWVTRNETVYLEPADRPGFTILIWRDPTDVVEIEAFQEALVVPGLLEAAIVAVVIMQSGHKLGDHGGGNNQILFNAIAGSIGANLAF